MEIILYVKYAPVSSMMRGGEETEEKSMAACSLYFDRPIAKQKAERLGDGACMAAFNRRW